jgi:hypothetical protein
MTTEKHGVELNLKQNVDKALKAAASAARQTRKAVEETGNAAGAAFDKAGMAIVVFNQGLELGKKALEVFRATIGASITTAMEFRKEGDEMTKWFKDLGRESQLVSARIGDVLMPVFRGFIEAIDESTGKMSDLVWENRKLIQTNLIEWIGGVAKALVTGVAKALQVVTKVWLGWKAVIQVVKIALNEYFEFVLTNVGVVVGAVGKMAEAFGAKGLGSKIQEASEFIKGYGAEFGRSSDDAQEGLAETAAAIEKTEKAISKMEGTIVSVIDRGMVNAQKRAAEATKGTTKTLDEQRAALEKLKAAQAAGPQATAAGVDKFSGQRIGAIKAQMARDLAEARSIDALEQAKAAAEAPSVGQQLGETALGAMSGPAGALASGFASGGPVGAGIAALGEFLANSQAFADIMEAVNEAVGQLFDALEPVVIALQPIVEMMLDVLTPVIKFVAKVLKNVATIILRVMITLAETWNGMLDALLWIFRKLGEISVFGKHPLGFLKDWADDLDKAASVSTKGMREALDKVENGIEDIGDGVEAAGDSVKDTVDQMARKMVGVPGIIKVALHEFRAADPAGGVGTGVDKPAAAVGGTQMNVETININGVEDPKTFFEFVQSETARTAEISHGVNARSMLSRAGLVI